MGLFGLLCMLWPGRAAATDLEDFQVARQAYDAGDYRRAVSLFEALIVTEPVRWTSGPLLLESRKYLGVSYLFVGRGADAERQFELLVGEDPSYQLDPLAFPEEAQKAFAVVRARVLAEQKRRAEQRKREEQQAQEQQVEHLLRERTRLARLLELAQTEQVVHVHSRWLALLPFGVGQFQNGDTVLGQVLAVTQASLVVTNLVSYLAWNNINQDARAGLIGPDRRDAARRARTLWRFTNQASFGLLAATAAAGVVHAQVRFQPSTVERRERPLPADLRLGLMPGGFRLAGRF